MYAAFQCRAGSYRTTSKPNKQPAQSTTKKQNYSHIAYADDVDIVGRSQSAVRDAYLVLEIESAKKVKNK
jgi:hypothetical protein